MSNDAVATLTFILISSFTPGPNNISSAALGALQGYTKTLKFLFGVTAGFFVVMFVCAWISASFLSLFPKVEVVLRYVGAIYILYLAYGILKASYSHDEANSRPMGFWQGFVLQLLNPKLMVYSLTLFSTFLSSIVGQAGLIIVVVSGLALVSFWATSTWALFGTLIKTYLRHPRVQLTLNITLSLLLIYTAFQLVQLV